jgi:hypothetical protein
MPNQARFPRPAVLPKTPVGRIGSLLTLYVNFFPMLCISAQRR